MRSRVRGRGFCPGERNAGQARRVGQDCALRPIQRKFDAAHAPQKRERASEGRLRSNGVAARKGLRRRTPKSPAWVARARLPRNRLHNDRQQHTAENRRTRRLSCARRTGQERCAEVGETGRAAEDVRPYQNAPRQRLASGVSHLLCPATDFMV